MFDGGGVSLGYGADQGTSCKLCSVALAWCIWGRMTTEHVEHIADVHDTIQLSFKKQQKSSDRY